MPLWARWLWDQAGHSVSLDPQSLRFLDATAERLEELQTGGSAEEPDPALLDELLTQAQRWLKEVAAERALNRGMQVTLTQHLENLIWTIENAERFGVGMVLPAADQTTGALLRATASTPGLWKRWGKNVSAFVGLVVLVATGINQTVDAVESTITIVQGELAAENSGAADGASTSRPDE